MTPPPVGRFAPSPTGPLHQGSLVAALASYLAVKSQGGQWLVRIEDLDPVREIAGMANQQLAALEAFGLVSDLPVLLQSRRSALSDAALELLLQQGKAFHCRCSRSLLAAEDGIHRHCVNTDSQGPASIRLRAADVWIEFNDGLFGRQRQNLARQVGDFVLKRADGLYAYQLAVVVDDALQGITQIVRGADLLDSTPRQIFLQSQLGLPTPAYLHVPLVLDENGLKLGKSQWAAAMDAGPRFRAFCAAWQHLGQDIGVLRPDLTLPDNLQIALRQFSPALIPAPGDRGPP